MKTILWFLIPAAAAVSLAQEPAPRKAPAKPAAKSARRPNLNPEGVPADAKKVSDYEWSHTDKNGQAWIYRKTPFSIAKLPDDRASGAAPAPAIPMNVRDLGDSVEFTRKTPFGTATWTKKKAELDASERAAVDAAGKK